MLIISNFPFLPLIIIPFVVAVRIGRSPQISVPNPGIVLLSSVKEEKQDAQIKDDHQEATVNASSVYPFSPVYFHEDTYHNVSVEDPYRWLEENSREAEKWLAAQTRLTRNYFKNVELERQKILNRLHHYADYDSYSCPSIRENHFFYGRSRGLQDFDTLHVAEGLHGGTDSVLLDPNTLSNNGTVWIHQTAPNPNGTLLAYDLMQHGIEWLTIRVRNVRTKTDLPDSIRWSKSGLIRWTKDGGGFFYSGYGRPPQSLQATYHNHGLYYHRVGTHQRNDPLVLTCPDLSPCAIRGTVTDDGRFLVISVQRMGLHAVAVLNLLETGATPRSILDFRSNSFRFAGSQGPLIYFVTDIGADRGRLVAVDTNAPEEANWIDVIPEKPYVLREASVLEGIIFAVYMQNAHSRVELSTTNGDSIRYFGLPGVSTIKLCGQIQSTILYSRVTWERPLQIYEYNIETAEHKLWRKQNLKYNPLQFKTIEIFVENRDGIKIHVSITSAANNPIVRDRKNPIILVAYGGFGFPLQPSFSEDRLVWCENGGLWITANIRGGGEYGTHWHEQGSLGNKRNSFNDLITVAEYFINHEYTTRDKIAIFSKCNGGILIGAAVAQSPDLFGAAITEAGIFDMLRYHTFTYGPYWSREYGRSDNGTEFFWLNSYSPYHNILRNGYRKYPSFLILTGDRDDRVVPSHSYKFTAALQKYQARTGSPNILLRVEPKAGHVGLSKIRFLQKRGDMLVFIMKELGLL